MSYQRPRNNRSHNQIFRKRPLRTIAKYASPTRRTLSAYVLDTSVIGELVCLMFLTLVSNSSLCNVILFFLYFGFSITVTIE